MRRGCNWRIRVLGFSIAWSLHDFIITYPLLGLMQCEEMCLNFITSILWLGLMQRVKPWVGGILEIKGPLLSLALHFGNVPRRMAYPW
jgi:hypothetical protein